MTAPKISHQQNPKVVRPRTGMDAETTRFDKKPLESQLEGLSLFEKQPIEMPAPEKPPVEVKHEKRAHVAAAGNERWILAGMPIAVEVAKRDGEVTAETFRLEAQRLDKLPPTYGDQRALAWIPGMFNRLCREKKLKRRTHPNGAPVKKYSKEAGNDQVVYELAECTR